MEANTNCPACGNQFQIELPQSQVKPSLGVAWGWTWRVLVCLFIIGLLLSIPLELIKEVNAYNAKLDKQAEWNSKPLIDRH